MVGSKGEMGLSLNSKYKKNVFVFIGKLKLVFIHPCFQPLGKLNVSVRPTDVAIVKEKCL